MSTTIFPRLSKDIAVNPKELDEWVNDAVNKVCGEIKNEASKNNLKLILKILQSPFSKGYIKADIFLSVEYGEKRETHKIVSFCGRGCANDTFKTYEEYKKNSGQLVSCDRDCMQILL